MENTQKILILNEGINILKKIFYEVKKIVYIGQNIKYIDEFVANLYKKYNVLSAPKNEYNFPSYTCISINECLCHGVAVYYLIKHGDLISIDISFKYNKYFFDCARTFHILESELINKKDIEDTNMNNFIKTACDITINEANKILKLNKEIHYNIFGQIFESIIKKTPYSICQDYGGHKIGLKLHEEPFIPSYNINKIATTIKNNDVFCFEPIISHKAMEEQKYIKIYHMGWNVINSHYKKTVHYENMYMLSENKIIKLT